MKSIATLQYDAEDIVQLVIRANPRALADLIVQDLAQRGYAVSADQLSPGPNGSVVIANAQLAHAAPPPPPPMIQAPQQAPAPPFHPWAPPPAPPQWQPPPAPPPPAQAYFAEPVAPPVQRVQAPPPVARPVEPAPLQSVVFGAPHAAAVSTGLPVVPGEEVLGRTPVGTLFTRLGTRPTLTGSDGSGDTDGYPDLAAMQSDAPTMTSRPGDGSDPRYHAVEIPDLEQPRQPRVREVGRPSGLADKVQREGMFSDGAAAPRLTGTGGFAWNPQGPGQGDPAPRPSFLDAFINNPNKE